MGREVYGYGVKVYKYGATLLLYCKSLINRYFITSLPS